MKTHPKVFRRVLEKAANELILASNEHPSTRDAAVTMIEIMVHYKDTSVRTACTPRIIEGESVAEEPVEEIPRKTAWEMLLEDPD